MNEYTLSVATLIVIQAIAASGLNVIVGYAGQISLGHAAFFGIGAYTCALLTTSGNLSFWGALPVVLLVAAGVGVLLGLPSLRLSGKLLLQQAQNLPSIHLHELCYPRCLHYPSC